MKHIDTHVHCRDWIETDNAPHTMAEKTFSLDKPDNYYMSGIRSLEDYSAFLEFLVNDGFTLG